MGKPTVQAPQPPLYRDDPDLAETASMSSAVLLDDIEGSFPDEELPSYEAEAEATSCRDGLIDPGASLIPGIPGSASVTTHMSWYHPPHDLPFSTHDIDSKEVRTNFPNYSSNAHTLLKMILEQASSPPGYYVNMSGTHHETVRNGNKETKKKVTDFFIRISLQHLLARGIHCGGQIELLPDNKRGYRGGRIISLSPTVGNSDFETAFNPLREELRAWCEKYVDDPHGVKSFTLKREITNHDTKKLEQLLRSAISETNYRGHVHIEFPKTHSRMIVYSPGKINEWRITVWIRWIFYWTFLWIFSWPFLFFITHRYEVVKAVYAYADLQPGADDTRRKPTVMSEVDWFHRWESAIKRAALARMNCKDRCLDEQYRVETANADARGVVLAQQPRQVPRTGNAFADGALGFLSEGLRVAEGFQQQRGWGGDC